MRDAKPDEKTWTLQRIIEPGEPATRRTAYPGIMPPYPFGCAIGFATLEAAERAVEILTPAGKSSLVWGTGVPKSEAVASINLPCVIISPDDLSAADVET